MEENVNKRQICSQAGYLPIPLRCVPAQSLVEFKIYLAGKDGYSLYSNLDSGFGPRDSQRLLENGVEFVYVSVKDHQAYYRTMEDTIENIVADPNIQQEKKSEILYATSIELSNQLLAAPPGKEEIKRTANLARATVQLIMKDKGAFGSLCQAFNHDFYTATHLVNICSMTISLAQKMGLMDVQILQQLGTGGLLHDIGKIFIPPEILNSVNPLTAQEYEIIQSHVNRGRQHLEKIMDLPSEMLAVVAEHHERIDGSGYPKGLKHDQLSPLGRLAGIVDTFDAMTSVRPYRSHTFSVGDALQEIEDNTPQKYDVDILHAFASMMEDAVPSDNDPEEKTSNSKKKVQTPTINLSGPKHTQYYFRIPIVVQRLSKIRDKITLGPKEKMISHKISCLRLGFLSNHPFKSDQNIYITSEKLSAIGMDKLTAVVINCHDHTGGWYTVDAKFHKPQSPEIIEKIKTITDVREISALVEHETEKY
ncbi:MAG: HD domain-containing protein [Sedimentisphaerales bacterium]|nr:HD domain-containing protein [Sedimentisphaerales bacterium]